MGRTPLEWNRPDSNRLCGIFRFHYANDGGVSRAGGAYCLEGSDILPVQLYRHGARCSMYKALKKHSTLQGRTPAQASLIEVDGKNR